MRRIAFLLVLALAATPSVAADRVLHLQITGPESALYENLIFEARLADVTDPAVEPTIVGGANTLRNDYELPHEITIHFDDADLVAGRTYGVEARVWQRSTLLFVTLEPLVIDPLTDETVAVRVDPPAPLALAETRWVGEDFGGVTLAPNGEPFHAILTFLHDDDGLSARFGLVAACGSWTGKAEFAGIRLVFTDLFEYMTDCPEEGTRFAEIVGGVVDATRTYAVEDEVLELRDAEGNVLGRFVPFVMPEN